MNLINELFKLIDVQEGVIFVNTKTKEEKLASDMVNEPLAEYKAIKRTKEEGEKEIIKKLSGTDIVSKEDYQKFLKILEVVDRNREKIQGRGRRKGSTKKKTDK
jgi:hypothetical protein